MAEITALDRGIIRNMMLKNSHKEISVVVGLDLSLIAAAITEMITGTAIVTRQMIIDQKKLSQPKIVRKAKPKSEKVIEKVWKEQKEQKASNFQHQVEFERKKLTDAWLARRSFKTIPVDLKKLTGVKIDDKTTIFIKPEEDKEEAIRKFYRNRLEQKKTEEIY